MSISGTAVMARMAIQQRTQEVLAAQKEFEQAISHLTPQRQTELLALRQIAIECARKRKFR